MLALIDVVKAFTLSAMTELLFVEQPHGFDVPGKVCRLNQALEGTKQAAHLWQENLNSFMISFGFERCETDPCLYKLVLGDSIIRAAVHVDDILVSYSDVEMYREFVAAFGAKFPCKASPVDTYLGMEIKRDRARRTITITQHHITSMCSSTDLMTASALASPPAMPWPVTH